jgi:hypothetical protein
MSTSDLTIDADHRTDADYIVALGIASRRHSAVAGPLMRVHLAGSHTAIESAYNSVLAMVKKLSAKKNWRLHGHALKTVAMQALSHHVDPVCPKCHGRKFDLQDDAPVLSTRHCKACNGTGRRPVQKKFRDEITQVIAALEVIDSVTERAVARLVK